MWVERLPLLRSGSFLPTLFGRRVLGFLLGDNPQFHVERAFGFLTINVAGHLPELLSLR